MICQGLGALANKLWEDGAIASALHWGYTHFKHSSAHLILAAASVLFLSRCPLFRVSLLSTGSVPPMQSWIDGGILLPHAHLTPTTLQIHHHTAHAYLCVQLSLACSLLLSYPHCSPFQTFTLVRNQPPNVLIILSNLKGQSSHKVFKCSHEGTVVLWFALVLQEYTLFMSTSCASCKRHD